MTADDEDFSDIAYVDYDYSPRPRNYAGEPLVQQSKTAQAAVARVRRLHRQYLPAFVDYDTCSHCNMLHGGLIVEPWPCPTIQALNGEDL